MSQKNPQGSARWSKVLETLWNRLRREAEGLLIAFSREGAERFKSLLVEGFPDERDTEAAARRLLEELAGRHGDKPQLAGAAAIDAAVARLSVRRKSHSLPITAEAGAFGIAPSDLPAMAGAPPPPPPPPPQAPAPVAAEVEPPRTAYARLDAPEVIAAEVEIEVLVGLAEKPTLGVAGGPMNPPAGTAGDYTLSLQLVADGFRLRDGETLRRSLPVTAADRYPTASFHLTPGPQGEKIRARTLQAFYEVEGQTLGMAIRSVAVVRDADLVAGAPKPALPGGVDVAIPTDAGAADLEIRILLDPDHEGRLLWTFNSRHAGIDLPDEALRTEIGSDPQAFARLLVDRVNGKEGKTGIYNTLSGIGEEIAQAAPPELRGLLRAAAVAAWGPPSVLILSQEPYVPWELAKVEEPLLDPAAPPFFAAQAAVGRWVLSRQESLPGKHQRPRQPPPTEIAVHSAAVISGVYSRPGWNRLKEAEAEAQDLQASLHATAVPATATEVLECLAGTPPADLLHFAVHGIYDPNGLQDGLMLTDGETLDPLEVSGTVLKRSPFVFLNACQVGSGNKLLGDYAGMAAAFLKAGAAGVVAPLWSVKDTIAREIAVDFYKATAEGASPAEALRRARKGFEASAKPQSATYLAYQFFGHPALKIRF
jgi:hypothetical protein